MIADITKTLLNNGFLSVIEYNESKVKSGEGERLMNTTGSLDPERMKRAFEQQLETNPSVRQNQLAKMVISFAPEDTAKLNEHTLNEVTDGLLKTMGYEGAALAYYHTDTGHHHLHLYTTTVNENGRKVQEYKDYDRLEELMRSYEIKYDLKRVEYSENQSISLSERHIEDYSLHNILSNDEMAFEAAKSFMRKDTITELLSKPMKNGEMLDRVGEEFGQEARDKLIGLIPQDAGKKLNKQVLIAKVDEVLLRARNAEDYFNRLNDNNIYNRIIYDKKSVPRITYGLKDHSFYISERKLPTRFRLDRINNLGKAPDPVQYEAKKQKEFIKNQVFRSLNISASLYQFENSLYLRGVRVITHSNASGIYGLSFESKNIINPISFKGSELHRNLSYKKIQDRLLKNSPAFDSTFYENVSKNVEVEKRKSVNHPVPGVGKLARNLDTNEESEERMRNPGLGY